MSEARKIELEEMLDDEDRNDAEEVAVFDDSSAEYLIWRIKKANEQYEKMEAWYKHQLQLAKETRDRTVAWAERTLRPYFDMVPTKGKKIRSYELRTGTLKLQKQEPKFEVNDDEMVPWLEANKLDFVKVTKEAQWGDYKKTLKDKDGNIPLVADENGVMRVITPDGELVPGVTATVREDKFTVTVK